MRNQNTKAKQSEASKQGRKQDLQTYQSIAMGKIVESLEGMSGAWMVAPGEKSKSVSFVPFGQPT